MKRLLLCLFAFLTLLAMPATTQAGDIPLDTVRVASGLNRPIFVTAPPGDYTRLFICEQRGIIKILDLLTGNVLPTPFLNIDGITLGPTSSFDERGLFSLAFDPNYDTNGYFYVHYTGTGGQGISRIARYEVSAANPNVANAGSAQILFSLTQPDFNHNGGMMAFGPNDGYLYIGFGDGGSANDPAERAQNGLQSHGKMLRVDVSSGSAVAPGDNPFVGDATHLDNIWHKGLRNPWRWSFDRGDPVTGEGMGDIYIGDVGQFAIEEISYQPASSTGGENYGWDCREGNNCLTNDVGCACNDPSLVPPIHTFGHGGGNCSVTGGYVYRGLAMPTMSGIYFYADFCSNQITSFVINGSGTGVTNLTSRTAELNPGVPGQTIASISSFGEDAFGELYIVDRAGTTSGEVYKIVPADIENLDCNDNNIVDSTEIEVGLALDCNNNGVIDSCDIASGTSTDANMNGIPDECEEPMFARGDCNNDGNFDLSDGIALLDHLFGGMGTPVACQDACDHNDSGGALALDDAIGILNWLFIMGAPPEPPYPTCGEDPSSDADGLTCDDYDQLNHCP